MDNENMCDECLHDDKGCDEIPCSSCMQWVDGYLEATRYEPKK